MRKLLLLSILMQFSILLSAQIPNGSIAPDFTMEDIEGNTHNLYTYLDSGYTVVLDFSAIWCLPCWAYHCQHELKELYHAHGPKGNAGVSDSTTNDIMVLFIEADYGTLAELEGEGNQTMGNWIDGTPYPILTTVPPNNGQITKDYQIAFLPTIMMVCPDRIVTQREPIPADELYRLSLSDCPPVGESWNNIKMMKSFSPEGRYCEAHTTPKIMIQNLGLDTAKSIEIFSTINSEIIDTLIWTGSLAQYETDTVTLNQIDDIILGVSEWKGVIGKVNETTDANPLNDTLISQFTIVEDCQTLDIEFRTDNFPYETSWDLRLNNSVIASGDNYMEYRHVYNHTIPLTNNRCYTFTIYDSGFDGITAGRQGYAKISINGDEIIAIAGNEIGAKAIREFCVGNNTQEPEITFELQINETGNSNAIHDSVYLVGTFTNDSILMTKTEDNNYTTLLNIGAYTNHQYHYTVPGYTQQTSSVLKVDEINKRVEDVLILQKPVGNNDAMGMIKIFPNPFKNSVTITNISQGSTIAICNFAGQILQVIECTNSTEVISTAEYNAGLYVISIRDRSNNLRTEKLIKY